MISKKFPDLGGASALELLAALFEGVEARASTADANTFDVTANAQILRRVRELEAEHARDVVAVRAVFRLEMGLEPEEWLRRWRAGELPDTTETNHALSFALALAEEP